MSSTPSAVPIIDFETLGLHRNESEIDNAALKDVGSKIKEAFSKVGFCYLKNHGFQQDLIDRYMAISKKFFDQPVEEKMKQVRPSQEINFGWTALEKEKVAPDRPGDLKEAFDYHPADDHDNWSMSEFQKGCKDMYKYCSDLSYRVCDALSVGLGLDKSFLTDAHKYLGRKGNPSSLRSLYYPPIPLGADIKPNQIRLGEHSDYGTITLLFQDDVGGLEVDIPGVGYVPATPIPGTVVVNIGELMERWTADKLIATKHRVLIPEVELKRRTHRQSVAFFLHADNDYVVECLDGSKRYEPVVSIDYLNFRFSTTY